ncbi:MAG: hypothetical protein IKP21_02355 [Bacteroidales bacterium]|nr:hypothetical protein [Bacteroidales bacterium]
MARKRRTRKLSQETKDKISKSLRSCHNPRYGKHWSETEKRQRSLWMIEYWKHIPN